MISTPSRRHSGGLLEWFRGLWRGTPQSDETTWTEIRVTSEPEAQDSLLVDVLAPWQEERTAQGGEPRVFFLRDRSGTTSRLHVWLDQPSEPEVEALAAAFRDGDRNSGQSARVDIRPGSSLDFVGTSYDGSMAKILLSEMMMGGCRLVLDQLVEIEAGTAARTSVAFDLMVAHLPAADIARVFPERYPRADRGLEYPATFPVYRSHAEGFFVMSVDPEIARSRFEEKYRSREESIQQRILALLTQLEEGPEVSQVASRWYKLARASLLRSEQAVRDGTLHVQWEEGYLGDEYDLESSPFHQIVQLSPALQKFVRTDVGYQAARFTLSGLYLTLGALGLPLVERFFLAYAISRAFEDLFTVDATAVVRNLAREVEAHG